MEPVITTKQISDCFNVIKTKRKYVDGNPSAAKDLRINTRVINEQDIPMSYLGNHKFMDDNAAIINSSQYEYFWKIY